MPMGIGALLPHDYARVHQAATESEAMFVQRVLDEAGIPAVVRSRQVPGYAEIIRGAIGYWGDVLVAVDDRERAEAHLGTYLRMMKGALGVARFAGIIPPLVTLFDQTGRIDDEANERHVDVVIASGVHGLFAMGST